MGQHRRQSVFHSLAFACALAAFGTQASCFGMIHEPQRHYYVLHLPPAANVDHGHIEGLIRVRELDTESAYDRLQMVIRKNTFELGYRQRDTWAVKPGRMLSDLLARNLADHNTFDGVTRELSERRPDYLLSGDLNALEVEQNGRLWQAHLAMSLQVTAMESGDVLWTGHFDEREPCASHDYGAAVEAMSTALARIAASTMRGLRAMPALDPPPTTTAPPRHFPQRNP